MLWSLLCSFVSITCTATVTVFPSIHMDGVLGGGGKPSTKVSYWWLWASRLCPQMPFSIDYWGSAVHKLRFRFVGIAVPEFGSQNERIKVCARLYPTDCLLLPSSTALLISLVSQFLFSLKYNPFWLLFVITMLIIFRADVLCSPDVAIAVATSVCNKIKCCIPYK